MTEAAWRWIGEEVALAAHEALLAEFGGLAGVRDRNALGSALARPRNLASCGAPDAAALAASYAFGLIRNHPFADGNKRVGYALAWVFLLDNGCVFTGTDLDSVQTILTLAAGDLTVDALAAWFRVRLQPGG